VELRHARAENTAISQMLGGASVHSFRAPDNNRVQIALLADDAADPRAVNSAALRVESSPSFGGGRVPTFESVISFLPPTRRRGRRRTVEHMTTSPGTTTDLVVETAGVSKRFGERTVVRKVDLQVPRGVAFAYLGPNGAGKTTLIRMLLGLTAANEGSMKLLGLPVPERRTEALVRVGAIVEEPSFHPHLTGRENLKIVAAARGRCAFGSIDGALERLGLAARADDRVKTYSLGMRQRLGIARCLLADPELLILDEPMNGMDPAGIQDFRAFVREFVAEGRTIVLSSHLLDEVEKTCSHVAIVDRGRIVAQGAIATLRDAGAPTVLIGVDDSARARALLGAHAAVVRVVDDGEALRVVLADANAVGELNRRLVEAHLNVTRVEPVHASLEQRFLEVTTRLENAA
jgi:ABC-2 type transport system ATP-binding protein